MKLIKELQDQATLTEMTEGIKFPKKDFEALKQMKDADGLSDDMMDKLYDFVNEYDPTWMPYGTQKARTGDPHEWISDHFDDIVDAIHARANLV